jgi:hypothetical protein
MRLPEIFSILPNLTSTDVHVRLLMFQYISIFLTHRVLVQ